MFSTGSDGKASAGRLQPSCSRGESLPGAQRPRLSSAEGHRPKVPLGTLQKHVMLPRVPSEHLWASLWTRFYLKSARTSSPEFPSARLNPEGTLSALL